MRSIESYNPATANQTSIPVINKLRVQGYGLGVLGLGSRARARARVCAHVSTGGRTGHLVCRAWVTWELGLGGPWGI